jgi:hypothetical protein
MTSVMSSEISDNVQIENGDYLTGDFSSTMDSRTDGAVSEAVLDIVVDAIERSARNDRFVDGNLNHGSLTNENLSNGHISNGQDVLMFLARVLARPATRVVG